MDVNVVQVYLVQLDDVWVVGCKQDAQFLLQHIFFPDNTLSFDGLDGEILPRAHCLMGDPNCTVGAGT